MVAICICQYLLTQCWFSSATLLLAVLPLHCSLQKKSREESSGTGSGVEILINEPYTDGPGGSGQYTHKVYHIGSHLPGKLTIDSKAPVEVGVIFSLGNMSLGGSLLREAAVFMVFRQCPVEWDVAVMNVQSLIRGQGDLMIESLHMI